MEELEEMNVIALLPEIVLDEMVNGRLEHERVVYSDEPDFRFLVPAWLSSAGERSIHNIIRNEEEGLQLCDLQNRTADYPVDGGEKLTSSTHQPRMAAFSYSSSVKVPPLRTSNESTTERPLLSFPPGTL